MLKLFSLVALLFPVLASAQSFDNPESVEYDVANSRWLVGNHGSGEVLVYSPSSGTLTPFCSGMNTGPYGIEILGSVLYCCDGSSVKGYDLSNGSQVFNLNIGATFLNGITSDGIANLFVTDYTAKKIYRVNVTTNAFNLMATLVKTPNGIIYDGAENRLVYATWGSNAAVQSLGLADSIVSTLIATTLGNMDGIIRDQQGNWYVSAWSPQGLHMFDPNFTNAPVAVMLGQFTQPADLGINPAGDSIAIPNSGSSNNVVFYALPGGCDAPVIEFITANPSCAGDSGAIDLIVSGGAEPYSFLWSMGATNEDLLAISDGTYTITVTDAVDCSATGTVTLGEVLPVDITLTPTADTQGPPNCNGSVTVSTTGGTPPYTFNWSGGITEPTDLCEGWYSVTAMDDNGCSIIDSVFIDFVTGVNNADPTKRFSLYPNPAEGTVMVSFLETNTERTIALVDVLGREIAIWRVSEKTMHLDLSQITSGHYAIVVKDNKNAMVGMNRLLIR